MPLPNKYSEYYFPIKYFTASYKCFLDGSRAVSMLEEELADSKMYLSDWKIHWVAACSLLRTSIALFVHDARICVSKDLAAGFSSRWKEIKANAHQHAIYWDFLHAERNNILHEYRWSAYSLYLDREGKVANPPPSLLVLLSDEYVSTLRIRSGRYSGRQAIDVIKEARDWVEEQILVSIRSVGLDPDEERNSRNFQSRPPPPPSIFFDFGKGEQ